MRALLTHLLTVRIPRGGMASQKHRPPTATRTLRIAFHLLAWLLPPPGCSADLPRRLRLRPLIAPFCCTCHPQHSANLSLHLLSNTSYAAGSSQLLLISPEISRCTAADQSRREILARRHSRGSDQRRRWGKQAWRRYEGGQSSK